MNYDCAFDRLKSILEGVQNIQGITTLCSFFFTTELMQTEVHHIHTLFIMSEIFRKGMKEELQLDHSMVDRIFPCLDELLEMHRQFFCRMKDRRQESCEAGSERNFVINRIGDILVQQVEASAFLIL